MWAIKVTILIYIQILKLQSAVVCYSVIIYYVVLQAHWATCLTYGVTSRGNEWMACKHQCASIHACVFASVCVHVCQSSAIPPCVRAPWPTGIKKKKFHSSLFYVDVAIWKSAISDQISGDMRKEIVSLKGTFPLQSHRLTSIVTHTTWRHQLLCMFFTFCCFTFCFPAGDK